MSCPECGIKRVKWRQGVGFDNEMLCYRCHHSFDPYANRSKVPQPIDEEIEELKAQRKEINARLKELKKAK